MVYDVTRPKTLPRLSEYWYEECLKNGLAHIPVVIVGNKIDLVEDRIISVGDGLKLSNSYQAPHFETSAKTGTNVDEMFSRIARDVYDHCSDLSRTLK